MMLLFTLILAKNQGSFLHFIMSIRTASALPFTGFYGEIMENYPKTIFQQTVNNQQPITNNFPFSQSFFSQASA
jgi:hypothetical protein